MGNFAALFDLISTEYGWTDDVIMGLTLSRLRQVHAAIQQRVWLRNRREEALVTWQTRSLAQFIGSLHPNPKGQSFLMREAGKLALRESKRHQTSVPKSRSEDGDGWTPETPVDYNDPRFERNSAERVALLVRGIEQGRG